MNVYDLLPSIPVNILVEPLVSQIQVTENLSYFYNIFDFTFFNYISKHEKLPLKTGIQMLDLLFKIYLNNQTFSQLASESILRIIQRFVSSESLQEFVIKFIKVALAIFYASEKKKRPKEKIMPLYNNRMSSNPSI